MDELGQFYKRFDQAVALLPHELRQYANVGWARELPDGTFVVHDLRDGDRELIRVDADGNVTDRKARHKAVEPPVQQRAPANMATRAYVDDVANGIVRGFGEALKKRIDTIHAAISALNERLKELEPAAVTKSLDVLAYDAMAEMSERMDRFEAQVKALADSGLRFCGYWRPGVYAQAGDSYSHDGSLWRANCNTTDAPSKSCSDWLVIARKGTDAR